MLAVGLLAVAILAVLGVFMSGLEMSRKSQDKTVALELGQEFFENLKTAGGYAAIPPGAGVFDGRLPDLQVSGFPPAPYPSLEVNGVAYQIIVRYGQHSSLAEVRAVMTEIRWGETGRATLETSFSP